MFLFGARDVLGGVVGDHDGLRGDDGLGGPGGGFLRNDGGSRVRHVTVGDAGIWNGFRGGLILSDGDGDGIAGLHVGGDVRGHGLGDNHSSGFNRSIRADASRSDSVSAHAARSGCRARPAITRGGWFSRCRPTFTLAAGYSRNYTTKAKEEERSELD